MEIILVLELEVAQVLPGEQPHTFHQMNRNTISPTPCNITKAPCSISNTPHIIPKDHYSEESEGYTKFLQT